MTNMARLERHVIIELLEQLQRAAAVGAESDDPDTSVPSEAQRDAYEVALRMLR